MATQFLNQPDNGCSTSTITTVELTRRDIQDIHANQDVINLAADWPFSQNASWEPSPRTPFDYGYIDENRSFWNFNSSLSQFHFSFSSFLNLLNWVVIAHQLVVTSTTHFSMISSCLFSVYYLTLNLLLGIKNSLLLSLFILPVISSFEQYPVSYPLSQSPLHFSLLALAQLLLDFHLINSTVRQHVTYVLPPHTQGTWETQDLVVSGMKNNLIIIINDINIMNNREGCCSVVCLEVAGDVGSGWFFFLWWIHNKMNKFIRHASVVKSSVVQLLITPTGYPKRELTNSAPSDKCNINKIADRRNMNCFDILGTLSSWLLHAWQSSLSVCSGGVRSLGGDRKGVLDGGDFFG
ncbi:hypothetical protein VP01_2881g3 [Puccinia sorghi]|uniref:Uncharacterized protein n=1 Tax=Puccinia sorghi TaxID=27349 RepID=A0A0L6V1R4_9BASI|nr:hypothetical protein VP01_2881g3 [Puccinia sorghi]